MVKYGVYRAAIVPILHDERGLAENGSKPAGPSLVSGSAVLLGF
jgi:hypothetical protein